MNPTEPHAPLRRQLRSHRANQRTNRRSLANGGDASNPPDTPARVQWPVAPAIDLEAIVTRALHAGKERAATREVDNEQLEADAAKWLELLADSPTTLTHSHAK